MVGYEFVCVFKSLCYWFHKCLKDVTSYMITLRTINKAQSGKGWKRNFIPQLALHFPTYSSLLYPCLLYLGPHIVPACLPKLHHRESFQQTGNLSFSLSSAIRQLGDLGQVTGHHQTVFRLQSKNKTLPTALAFRVIPRTSYPKGLLSGGSHTLIQWFSKHLLGTYLHWALF